VSFKITRVDDLPAFSSSTPVFPAGVIDLQQIAGPFVDENDSIVSEKPNRDEVLAQILFENGYSTGLDSASVFRTWTLPATLTNVSTTVTIADPVYIEFPGVRRVDMIDKPIPDDGSSRSQTLTPNGSTIEILVSNRCFIDKNGQKIPRNLTIDDIECRLEENGFRIVQVDKDFAFNYQMLHPATRASLSKFLPQDPQTGQPRFPVPESDLLSVASAFPFCLEEILTKLSKDKALSEGDENAKKNEIKDLKRKWVGNILDLVQTGSGTGSGSDCLGSSGLIRFVNLDSFIPPPGPATVASSMPSADSLAARPGALASSTLGNPPQVIRNQTSPAPVRSRGQASGATPSSQADQTAPSADKPQNATRPQKP
jgi:hypothetical protein